MHTDDTSACTKPQPSPEDIFREKSAAYRIATGFDWFPGQEQVVPGHSDSAIEDFLKSLMRVKNRKREVVMCLYAGMLGATSPKQEDFHDPSEYASAYQPWLKSCTPKQIEILDFAAADKRKRKRELDNEAYAERIFSEQSRPVRAYVRDRTDADKAAKNSAYQKRHRAKLKAERQAAQTEAQAAAGASTRSATQSAAQMVLSEEELTLLHGL